MFEAIITVICFIANWFIFKKAGREGWEGIIPVYNTYVQMELLYGNGMKFLLFLIPFYNIYLIFKLCIDWAHAFNKSTGFGLGLVFLAPIFTIILAFSDAQYGDGSKANRDEDLLVKAANAVRGAADKPQSESIAEKLESLKALYDAGTITEEEFNAKKEDLLSRM